MQPFGPSGKGSCQVAVFKLQGLQVSQLTKQPHSL